jgi:hypothetical protein
MALEVVGPSGAIHALQGARLPSPEEEETGSKEREERERERETKQRKGKKGGKGGELVRKEHDRCIR